MPMAAADLLRPEDFVRLEGMLRRSADRAIRAGLAAASGQLDTVLTLPTGGAELDAIYAAIGERIVGISAVTQEHIAAYVATATNQGMSPQQLAALIRGDRSGAFGRYRAAMIARTESAIVYNQSSLAGYRASGMVDEVRVFDGDGCGWSGHDHPDKADGSTRTLDEAQATPVSHPHCVRSWAPIVSR